VTIEEADVPMRIEHVTGLEFENLRIAGQQYERDYGAAGRRDRHGSTAGGAQA